MPLWKFRRRKKCLILLIIIAALVIAKFVEEMMIHLKIDDILDMEKCPFCYGTSFCETIHASEISILHSKLSAKVFTKNVYHGTMNETKVVIKKLASDEELAEFDDKMKEKSLSYENIEKMYDFLLEEMNSNFTDVDLKLRLCASMGNKEKLFEKFQFENWNLVHLWTMLKINPEPFLLTILPAEEGWPVPFFYGACGRLIIENLAGSPLTDYKNVPWLHRAKIASSLLDVAHKFTFAHPHFAFYMTDWSWYNIAVDSQNNAKFVDLEHVIIVEKWREDLKFKDKIHKSESFEDCKGCFTFSALDICNHKLSDHNYFGVCQQIISSRDEDFAGLLHNVPDMILRKFPNLTRLIEECSEPKDALHERITIGIELKEALDEILRVLTL